MTAEEVKARGYNLDIKNPHTVADDHGDPEELLAEPERRRGRDGELARPVEGDPGRGAGAMNAERLLAHYERIADAPDAIAAAAPLHSRSGRARQAGAAGPERRTGVGIAEADCGGEGAAGEGGGDQEAETLTIDDGRAAIRCSRQLALDAARIDRRLTNIGRFTASADRALTDIRLMRIARSSRHDADELSQSMPGCRSMLDDMGAVQTSRTATSCIGMIWRYDWQDRC